MYEYKLVAVPKPARKGFFSAKAKSYVMEAVMNDMAAEHWEFQRAEMMEETGGFFGHRRILRQMLVFRRAVKKLEDDLPALPAPEPTQLVALPAPKPAPKRAPSSDTRDVRDDLAQLARKRALRSIQSREARVLEFTGS
ncbi:MAG: DUF4177 domain-containing protein [Pseudomonadota bacterium]